MPVHRQRPSTDPTWTAGGARPSAPAEDSFNSVVATAESPPDGGGGTAPSSFRAGVEFRSVLRIRPFTRGEERDEEGHEVEGESGDGLSVTVVALRPLSDGEGTVRLLRPGASASSGRGGGGPSTPPPCLRRSPRKAARSAFRSPSPPRTRRSAVASGDDNDIEAGAAPVGGGSREEDADDFRFDAVLSDADGQDALFTQVGSIMAYDAAETLLRATLVGDDDDDLDSTIKEGDAGRDHVVVSLGVSNSGKTHTVFGGQFGESSRDVASSSEGGRGGSKGGNDDKEGLVPRLIEDLFAQYERHGGGGREEDGGRFAVGLSMVHVHNDKVYDMLSSSSSAAEKTAGEMSTSADRARVSSHGAQLGPSSAVRRMVASYETGGTATAAASTRRQSLATKPASSARASGRRRGGEGDAPMAEIQIRRDSSTGNFSVQPEIATCRTSEEARTLLLRGLDRAVTASTGINSRSSRGHTVVTLRPLLLLQQKRNAAASVFNHLGTSDDDDFDDGEDVVAWGGTVTVIDTAGIERTRRAGHVSAAALRESVSINSTVHGVLQCLRAIKRNTLTATAGESGRNVAGKRGKEELVPYRQGKLTMLLQPLFSGRAAAGAHSTTLRGDAGGPSEAPTTRVTLLVSAYPGAADHAEKKALLSEIHALRGLKVRPTTRVANPLACSSAARTRRGTPRRGSVAASPSPSKRHRHVVSDKENRDDATTSSSTTALSSSHTKRLKTSSSSPLKTSSSSPLRERGGGTASSSSKKSWMKKRSPLKRISAAVGATPAAAAACKKLRGMGSIAVGDATAAASAPAEAAAVVGAENDELSSRLGRLEGENADLRRRNRALEERCAEVLRENATMASRLERVEAAGNEGGGGRRSEEEDERAREAEREERLRRNNPLDPALVDHMERVDRTLGDGPGRLTWGVAGRAPFPVSVPEKEEWTCSKYYEHQDTAGPKSVLQAMGEALEAKVQKSVGIEGNSSTAAAIEGKGKTKDSTKELCNEMQKVADFAWF